MRVFRRYEAAVGEQRGSADFQLAAEHETAELRGDLGRVAVRQQHQQVCIVLTQECEDGNHAPLRRQPRVPLPLPNRQRLYVIGKLGMRKRHCIRTGQSDVLHVVQGAKTLRNKIQVVSHGRGGLKSPSCESTMIGHPTPPQRRIPRRSLLLRSIFPRKATAEGDWWARRPRANALRRLGKNGRCIDF